MRTFILKWNPAISSVTIDDWNYMARKQLFINANWSVHDHKKLNVGDRWFMLRVGEGKTGIVGHGYFKTNPQKAEDWSGKGRPCYYCDLEIGLLCPDDEPMISTEELERNIPQINWRAGHSGTIFPKRYERALNNLFNKYYEEHHIERPRLSIEPGTMYDIEGWTNFSRLFEDVIHDKNFNIFSEDVFHDMVTLKTEHIYGQSVFTFTILLRNRYVLPVICKGLQRIKTEIYGGYEYQGHCKIWFDNHYFHVNINEVEVICDRLEFGEASEYEKDTVAVTI